MPATFFFMRTIPLVCGAEIPYDLFSNLAMDLLKYLKRIVDLSQPMAFDEEFSGVSARELGII